MKDAITWMKIFRMEVWCWASPRHLPGTAWTDCREGVNQLCDRDTTPYRDTTQTDLGKSWPTLPLSPECRIALCTAGSRSSSNIIGMFLPCLCLLLSTLQSSVSQKGCPRWLTSCPLSYHRKEKVSLSRSSDHTSRTESHWL